MAVIASGLFLLLPAYTTFHVGERPTVRLPARVNAMIIAIIALPAANFGGFVVGTLLGIMGASLIHAWTHSPTTPEPAVTQ